MVKEDIKKILQIFFMHPVDGLLVKDKEEFIGIVLKGHITKFLNYTPNSKKAGDDLIRQSLLPIKEDNINKFCPNLDPLPIITLKGEMAGYISRVDLLDSLKEKVPVLSENVVIPAETSNSFSNLDLVGVPVLVISDKKIIEFANKAFLKAFGFDAEFVLTQNPFVFFPKLNLEAAWEGNLTYAHKLWKYNVQYNIEHFCVSFCLQRTRASYDYASEMKKLANGTETLDSLRRKYENKIINQVAKKTKKNTRAMANWLGIEEEILLIKMSAKKK